MKIVVGCDEAAYKLKEEVKFYLIENCFEVVDVGVYNEEPSLYPDTAYKLCEKVIDQTCERGILMCGTGIGMAITANKIPGIRAAVCHDLLSLERSIKSNNCQILCLGARVIGAQHAKLLIKNWLSYQFEGGASEKKIERITEIEEKFKKRSQVCKE